ncbi:unnamed protein product [Closterium sp. NIES-54]
MPSPLPAASYLVLFLPLFRFLVVLSPFPFKLCHWLSEVHMQQTPTLQVEWRGVGVYTDASPRPSPVAVQRLAGTGGREAALQQLHIVVTRESIGMGLASQGEPLPSRFRLSLAMQQRQLTGPVAAASATGSTGAAGEGREGDMRQHLSAVLQLPAKCFRLPGPTLACCSLLILLAQVFFAWASAFYPSNLATGCGPVHMPQTPALQVQASPSGASFVGVCGVWPCFNPRPSLLFQFWQFPVYGLSCGHAMHTDHRRVCALQVAGRGVGVITDASPRPSPVAVQGLMGTGGRQRCSMAVPLQQGRVSGWAWPFKLCVSSLQVEGRGAGVNTDASPPPSPVAVQEGGREAALGGDGREAALQHGNPAAKRESMGLGLSLPRSLGIKRRVQQRKQSNRPAAAVAAAEAAAVGVRCGDLIPSPLFLPPFLSCRLKVGALEQGWESGVYPLTHLLFSPFSFPSQQHPAWTTAESLPPPIPPSLSTSQQPQHHGALHGLW